LVVYVNVSDIIASQSKKSLISHTLLSFIRRMRNDICAFMHNFTSPKSAVTEISFCRRQYGLIFIIKSVFKQQAQEYTT